MRLNLTGDYTPISLLGIVLLVATAILYPGLSGPLLLDDTLNLNFLLPLVVEENLSFWELAASDPKVRDRVLPFASFYLQLDHYLVGNTEALKRFNLIVHLLNVVLVYVLSLLISPAGLRSRETLMLAAMVALIWAVHPQQQSTVFYVVQRMTSMSTFFVLLGCCSYCYLRRHYNASSWYQLGCLIGVVYSFVVLGGLCKQSAFLLIFYIAMLEYWLGANRLVKPLEHRTSFYLLLLAVPLSALAVVLALRFPQLDQVFITRDFTPIERLLTQTRVLCLYLYQIWIPSLGNSGLFHDDIIKSVDLLTPVTTLYSLLFLAALITLGFASRKRAPILCFAIGWYFLGHVMESTALPLEIAFEHRNYLPIFGCIFLFASVVVGLARQHRILSGMLCVVAMTVTGGIALWNSDVWSSSRNIAVNWALTKPASMRAQHNLAEYWLSEDYPYEADKVYSKISGQYPRHAMMQTVRLNLRCRLSIDTSEDIANYQRMIPGSVGHVGIAATLDKLVNEFLEGRCQSATTMDMVKIFKLYVADPAYAEPYTLSSLFFFLAKIHVFRGEADLALQNLEASVGVYPARLDVYQWQLSIAMSLKNYSLADSYLEGYERALDALPLVPSMHRERYSQLRELVKKRASVELKMGVQRG
ncbi:hypothetical protein HBA55_10605 [Pseudomaricurvus alkylphenolicus]|uniref:hypothetical protein n=1 Tax=Pseudomaricurvus alkylphenolicus TaxID=1306991 RepID=UPI00141D9F95|nr:hypothetical protein [Pseudomaricurvus alkylphenolicus]NIB40040.1 hypothetical protein [Pseudomaricurvus alkylphenolicus]